MDTICVEYCNAFPEMKDYTLARKIFNEHPGRFRHFESVRSKVRRIRGHNGNYHRNTISDMSNFKPITHDTTNSKPEIIKAGKILVLDIETAPIRAYVWGIWNQNIALNQIDTDWFMLTWAAKWLFEDKVYSAKLTPKEVKNQDDRRISKGIWELINEADIVIAHNAAKFDIPKLNSRFILNGLNPPMPYQIIDTLVHIRRQFGFISNKLDYVNKLLKLPRKTETGGFELWEKCLKGDREALAKMEQYNIGDVRILEETYLHIRPWIKPHPNVALFILDEKSHRCPSCGSADLREEGKLYYTSVNAYEQYRCGNCGAAGRKRVAKTTIKERRTLLSSSPR